MLTLPIVELVPATPRARIVRLDLGDRPFDYAAGQAVLVATHGRVPRRPYSIAIGPAEARRTRRLELLVGIDHQGQAGAHLALNLGGTVDVEGPVGSFTFPSAPE